MAGSSIFAQRLRLARNQQRKTQKELADAVSVAGTTISAYEQADDDKRISPTLENAVAIAQALNVSLDYLCGIDDLGGMQGEKSMEQKVRDYLAAFTETLDLFPCTSKIHITDYHTDNDGHYKDHGAKLQFTENSCMSDFLREWKAIRDLYFANTIDAITYKSVVDVLCDKYTPLLILENKTDDIPF